MTPCEKLGYKVGDKFITKGSYTFGGDSIIELEHDDGSEMPLFKLISGHCKYNNAKGGKEGAYCCFNFVKKIEEKEMTHQKKPHRHADIMKAYADDLGLILFSNGPFGKKWHVVNRKWPSFNEGFKYFLCLPKHKEVCLHWLSGGDIQYRRGSSQEWDSYGPIKTWTAGSVFMQDHVEIRIKRSKETRYAVIHNGRLVGELFKFDYDIRASYGAEYHELQIFKIEVEV